MALNDLFNVEIQMNVGQNPVSFYLGYRQTSATIISNEDSTGACALAAAEELAGFAGALSVQTTLEAVRAVKVVGDPEPPGITLPVAIKGTRTGQSIPPQKAALVTHKQQDADVMSNGKSFVSGLSELDTDASTITAGGVLAVIQNTFNNWLTTSVTITLDQYDFEQVVLKDLGDPNVATTGLTVTESVVVSMLYNQRRRRTREFGYAPLV